MKIDLDSLFGKPDGNVFAEMHLLGSLKTYSLTQFNVTFSQKIDQFGEPQSEASGGQMLVAIPQLPDKEIMKWAAGSRVKKSGEIVFRNETQTPYLRVIFTDAYCVCFNQQVNAGSSCSFTISPRTISLNGEASLENWVEKNE